MSDNQGEIMMKLTDALNNIGLDIREIKTTLKHFDEKFGQVQKDLSNVRIQVGETEHEVESLKINIARQELKIKENKDDIDRLFEKNRERDNEAKGNRKLIITTLVSSGLTIVGFAITIALKLIGL